MKSKLLALLLLSSCLGLPASAQDISNNTTTNATVATTTSDDTADIDAMVEKVNIITRASSTTELPENDPIPLDLGLVEVPGVSTDLTKGVTAKAYARYVSVDGMKIGQLVLSSVEKGDRVEALNSDNFVAQFDLNQPALDPSSPISVEGNKEELTAALERLAAIETEEQPEEEEVADSGVGASNGDPGSNASSNPDASEYTTPSSLEVADDPVITSNITTEGCEMRIDLDQLQAIQQTRVITTTDGAPEYSDCADGDQRFKIDKSYSACPYDEDTEAMKATAYFIYYYNDASGNRQEHGECQADPDKVFDIIEDTDTCRVILDYNALEAVTYAKLVYTNHNGKVETVRDCMASATIEPAVMTPTTEGCDIRDDFTANTSYQRGKYIYEINGTPYATACTDNGTEYPQETVYKTAAGDNICTPIVNHNTHTVTLQSRVQIVVNGLTLYRTACTPDTAAKDMASTVEGCEDPAKWTHKLSAGQSFGSERFFYIYQGEKEYVTGCQDSTEIFDHQIEVTGWQPHDEQLFAYPLTTVYIEDTPVGKYNIVTSAVLEGAVQVPYTYLETVVEANGQFNYEGCTKFALTANVEKYQRPDESIFKKEIDAADPVNQGNDCRSVVTWNDSGSSYKKGTSVSNHGRTGPNGQSGPYRYTYSCYKQTSTSATNALTRNSDNVVVQTLGPNTAYASKSTSTQELITEEYGGGMWDKYCKNFWNNTSYYSTVPTATKNQSIVNWGWQ